jgi:hypothetical protein
MNMVSGMGAQNKASQASQAAQGAQGNALLGESNIAQSMLNPPDYSGIVKAEQSGINTLKSGVGGVANPNSVVGDMGGQNISRAISGANSDQLDAQKAAAGILGNTSSAYNQIGTQAGSAAQAQGNPFSLFSNALQGAGGLGGLFGGSQQQGGGGLLSGGQETAPGITPPAGGALASQIAKM